MQTPERRKAVRILRFTLIAVGVFGVLISLPLLGFAGLGFLGFLADVSPSENRDMGIQLLVLGLPILICGVLMCLFGRMAFAQNHGKAHSAPGSSADGDVR